MYLLIVKDGFRIRYIGPYPNTRKAYDDLQRVLIDCTNKASWQIHSLESPSIKTSATSSAELVLQNVQMEQYRAS